MNDGLYHHSRQGVPQGVRRRGKAARRLALGVLLLAWLPAACSWMAGRQPPPDAAALAVLSQVQQTNRALERFKCIGKLVLRDGEQVAQSSRVAVAGQMPDQLRIDLMGPVGGSAGSVASDGKWLYAVVHSPREYHKTRLGSGSLRRFAHIDVRVAQLVDLFMGRIPVSDELSARLERGDTEPAPGLLLTDRWGRIRQRIILDETLRPVESVWLDRRGRPTLTVKFSGSQRIDAFVLPERIELVGASGRQMTLSISHYEANARLPAGLFTLPPPAS